MANRFFLINGNAFEVSSGGVDGDKFLWTSIRHSCGERYVA